MSVDFGAVTAKQQKVWGLGDYGKVGSLLSWIGESLVRQLDVHSGERVLDVAAGNGNATLAAARRFADVISTDYVPTLLEKGRERARAEGLPVRFQVADVEALPFEDGRFDAVLATFGAMFAPNHARTAKEMMRVLRDGGRLGVANWTPEGFIGRMFKVMAGYVPPPAGVQSPVLWGQESHIDALFRADARHIRCERRFFKFRYRSAAHFLQVFRDYYGPTHKAFASLDEVRAQALERDLLALLEEMNTGGASSLVIPSEYLEVVVTKW